MESPLKVAVIAGGSGLIGQALAAALLRQGMEVRMVTRSPHSSSDFGWDQLDRAFEGAQAIFNLAGAGIAEGRWTPARKTLIRDSRTGSTRRIVQALQESPHPPVLVNASATGYYGHREEPVDENTSPGKGFLAETCLAWETEADLALPFTRVVKLRIGVVLDPRQGALPRILLPLRLFQGTALGNGRQGLSWIHREDLVRLLIEAANDPAFEGALNATAPNPCSNREFTRTLGQHLHRPVWPIPAVLTRMGLNLALGEMAQALLLEGAFVLPRRAEALGFEFQFPTLSEALKDLLP